MRRQFFHFPDTLNIDNSVVRQAEATNPKKTTSEAGLPPLVNAEVSESGKTALSAKDGDIVLTYENKIMYTNSVRVSLYAEPKRVFDSRLATLSYGIMVMVVARGGEWLRVMVGEMSGWVLKADLVDRQARVHPQFIDGKDNRADDPNTVQLRAIIGDTFMAGELRYPLTAPEYVLYRLVKKNKTIKWPPERPRLAGRWHKILKGGNGIHISIEPKTDAVMEYTAEDGTGHLVYIEAYFSDGTVVCSGITGHSGTYNDWALTRLDWRELKPVFIMVT